MRAFITLIESMDPNRLYHGTSITGLCNIAHSNMLGALGGEEQASFTLDSDIAMRFAASAVDNTGRLQLSQYGDWPDFHDGLAFLGEETAGGHGAVMVFDRAALHRDYDFKSVGFDSDGLERVDFDEGDELEECVFGDIANLASSVYRSPDSLNTTT
jgi:hypothetical protein